MENNSKVSGLFNTLSEWTTSFSEWIQAQQWFNELKTKWDSLDLQHKRIIQLISLIGIFLFILFLFLNALWSTHRLKKELENKNALLSFVQLADEEIKSLQGSIPNIPLDPRSSPESPWNFYFEDLASSIGITKENVMVSDPNPGSMSEQSKEFLIDITLKHINLKQVVGYALALENGKRPIKIRNLMIDTKNDPSGYLETTLAVSAFTLIGG